MAGNTTVSTAPAGYSAEIAELIRSSLTPRRMQEKLSSYHENDVASALELLTQTERAKLYQILDSETLALSLIHIYILTLQTYPFHD